jgi:uncharacterized protein YdaU (DUF1376 family)
MTININTWMPLYIYDFLGGTINLHLHEQAAYLRLLMHAWKNRGELPADDQRLATITSMTRGSWKKSKATILAFFYVSENGMLRQQRLDRELERAHALVNQRSEAGKASAAKRKAGREAQQAASDAMEEALYGDALHQGRDFAANPVADLEANPATDVSTNQATELQREPQRNSIPLPLHKTKETNNHHQPSSPEVKRERDDFVATDWGQWRTFFQNECGVTIDANSLHDRKKFMPLATGWLTAGVTFGQMRAAIARARSEARETIAYLPGYADRVLAGMSAPPSRNNVPDSKWNFAHLDRSSDMEAMLACAAYHGIDLDDPRGGLDFDGNPFLDSDGNPIV